MGLLYCMCTVRLSKTIYFRVFRFCFCRGIQIRHDWHEASKFMDGLSLSWQIMKVILRTLMSDEGVWSHNNSSGTERQKLYSQPNEIIKTWSNATDFQCLSTWCWQTMLYTSKKPDNEVEQSNSAMLKMEWKERWRQTTPLQLKVNFSSSVNACTVIEDMKWRKGHTTLYSPYSSISGTNNSDFVSSGVQCGSVLCSLHLCCSQIWSALSWDTSLPWICYVTSVSPRLSWESVFHASLAFHLAAVFCLYSPVGYFWPSHCSATH